ncbi:MAG: RNA polymerase sigma factor [Thermodesulfobacteriota bacterium]
MSEQLVNKNDEELLELINKKDHPAFSELVRRYSKKFYAVSYRILGNRDDSEDMVQDAFLKLWNESDLWESKFETKFTTWFYRVFINQCLDYKRKKGYRNHDEYEESSMGEHSTGIIMEQKSSNELINKYIMELPEKQQIALNLCYYENLTREEAGEIMELTTKGVQSLVSRAKENLKSKLRKYYKQEAI